MGPPSPGCSACGAPRDSSSPGLCPVCLFKALAPDDSSGVFDGDARRQPPPDVDGFVSGCRLGPYEILAPIGRGGMGVVYRARDARLDRDVAIKAIPGHLTLDDQTRRAFEREARILAGLNHPHICAVYDVGHARGFDFIVMEYAAGHTLAERLESGALAAAEIVRCATEIADALAEAHRLGIAHGDLKPANIMLTDHGVKLLDFGLATTLERSLATSVVEVSAGARRVAGTLQYMSPEQRQGHRADARSDLYAVGLMLQQMAAACHDRDALPSAIDQIMAGCLMANPERRWQKAQEILVRLRWIDREAPRSLAGAVTRITRHGWSLAASALVVLGVVVTADWLLRFTAPPAALVRFSVSPPPVDEGRAARGLAFISPDGTRLAWRVSDARGRTSLAIQALDSAQVVRLPETADATFPFWSPDSRQIAFFADGFLKKTPAGGGIVQTLAPAMRAQGGTWIDGDTIVFSPGLQASLSRVSARGGEVTPITAIDAAAGEVAHQWPVSLLDGRHLVYFAMTRDPAQRALWMLDLKTGARARLCAADSGAGYAPIGHLVFQRGRGLLTATVDVGGMRVIGDPTSVVARAFSSGKFGPPYFSVATTGTIVSHERRIVRSQLIWFDRDGRRLRDETTPEGYRDPVLSPDRSEIVVQRFNADDTLASLWRLNLATHTWSPVAPELAGTGQAVWSPDGARIAFTSTDGTTRGLYEMPAHGGVPTLLATPPANLSPSDWSRDGRFLLYAQTSTTSKTDLWVLPMAPRAKPFAYVSTRWSEEQGRFSPDGRWVAYTSDESGHADVYVRHFPDTGARWQVSSDGGSQPAWHDDGRGLFYLSRARRVMSVGLREIGQTLRVDAPQLLFELPRGETLDNRNSYAVSKDGRQFLFNVQTNDPIAELTVANVVLNWFRR